MSRLTYKHLQNQNTFMDTPEYCGDCFTYKLQFCKKKQKEKLFDFCSLGYQRKGSGFMTYTAASRPASGG